MKFVSKYDVGAGKNRYFTKVIDSLNSFGRLSLMKEPVFSVGRAVKDPLIHFEITCRVIPYEKKK
jgi:hypothetical protein